MTHRHLHVIFSLPILLFQSILLALTQIWANKLRSVLTTLGIVIGVASVTTVIAALTGLQQNVLAEFETLGTNKIFVLPSNPGSGPRRRMADQLVRFQPELFDDMLQHTPSLGTFTRVVPTQQLVSYEDEVVENVDIAGIEPSWHEIENRDLEIGRPFSLVDVERGNPVAIINPKLRERLGLPRDPTGTRIQIGGRGFAVIGVVKERSESSMGFSDGVSDSEVFVPFLNAWQAALSRTTLPFMYVIASARDATVATDAQAEIRFFLRKARRIDPGEPDTFDVRAVDQFLQSFNRVAVGITVVAGGIVGISLLVGGIGIMNIMLVSVSERTREIGLRKAVGARPGAIMLQFLIEAVVLCCLGGAVGVAIGQLLTLALSALPGALLTNAAIPGWAIALSLGFAAAVGVVFGFFPAVKAARLDPIEALRHE